VWIAKKNGKSPTLAAWGLYLLCADGEQGQKVYSVAKDGKQAMIAHTHAIEMVRRSPALSPDMGGECTINRSTGQITYHPTSSVYKVVAGDNPQSQEGLNGSSWWTRRTSSAAT
jgi:phage terminase large subunit-like protein